MRIMNKEQFARTPPGTVYCQFEPYILDEAIQIKTDYSENNGSPNFVGVIPLCPFFTQDYNDKWNTFDGMPSETTQYMTDCFSNDTALCDYDDNQLFAVFSKDEVRRMIDVLTYALCGCEGRAYTDDDDMIMD